MEHFLFKKEWREALKGYSAEVRAEVYEAVLAYAFEGEVLPMSELAKMAFSFIKLAIDAMQGAYQEKCNRNRDSANRRWAKGKEVEQSQGMPNDANGCEGMPNDANGCEGMQSNQIKSNQIKSNQGVCEKNAHTDTRTHEEKIFDQFNEFCEIMAPTSAMFKEPLTLKQFERLYAKYGAERIKRCAVELHNKEAYKKNRTAIVAWEKFIQRIT